MTTIAEALGLRKDVLAIIGSGGKTSVLWRLAQSLRQERVLVSTSVKMWPATARQFDHPLPPAEAATLRAAAPGVTFADTDPDPVLPGPLLPGPARKTGPFPADLLARLFPLFDVSLIEADGSRGLPLKGWAAHEPVIPPQTTLTLAVLPLPREILSPAPSRMTATEAFVHRLPLFLDLAGARAGEAIRPEHLAAVIAHPRGLLARTRGRAALFFNQVESPEALAMARHILDLLPGACRRRLWRVLAGSARWDTAELLSN